MCRRLAGHSYSCLLVLSFSCLNPVVSGTKPLRLQSRKSIFSSSGSKIHQPEGESQTRLEKAPKADKERREGAVQRMPKTATEVMYWSRTLVWDIKYSTDRHTERTCMHCMYRRTVPIEYTIRTPKLTIQYDGRSVLCPSA
jgi:hypothetical protein